MGADEEVEISDSGFIGVEGVDVDTGERIKGTFPPNDASTIPKDKGCFKGVRGASGIEEVSDTFSMRGSDIDFIVVSTIVIGASEGTGRTGIDTADTDADNDGKDASVLVVAAGVEAIMGVCVSGCEVSDISTF